MDNIKQKISYILGEMDFERKSRVTKKEKEMFSLLSDKVFKVKKETDKLNLRLWHCTNKGDYHSFSISDAKAQLEKIYENIGAIITCLQ
jgi:hypothetical protein